MIFVISLCCPFWPVLKHFVVSGTGTCWFISWKGKGVALKGMQRRKDDENIICAVSTRESKEEGKLKFHGNPGRNQVSVFRHWHLGDFQRVNHSTWMSLL